MSQCIFIISALFCCCSFLLNVQSFNIEKYNAEKEEILNVIVNSVQFDSVYTAKQICFKSNELLSEKSPLCIKKGKKRVKIREVVQGQYVVIGDFTMEKVNSKAARVQLEILPQETLLNLRLEKLNGIWRITNHIIMKE